MRQLAVGRLSGRYFSALFVQAVCALVSRDAAPVFVLRIRDAAGCTDARSLGFRRMYVRLNRFRLAGPDLCSRVLLGICRRRV